MAASTLATWRVGGQIDEAALTNLGSGADIVVTAELVGNAGRNIIDPTNGALVLRGPYTTVVGSVATTGGLWWTEELKATDAADAADALQPSGLAWRITVGGATNTRRGDTYTLGKFRVAVDGNRNYDTQAETIQVPSGTAGALESAIDVTYLTEPPSTVVDSTFNGRVSALLLQGDPGPTGPAGAGISPGWFVAGSTYGIVGDGETDDTAGFQAWIDAMADYVNDFDFTLKPGVVGIIPPGVYFIASTITIPETSSASATKLVMGYGANMRAGGAFPVFATTTPADSAAADSHVSLYTNWTWEGLTVDGSRIADSKAFSVKAVGRWTVKECVFQDLDRAFDCEFMLGSEFINCQFSNSNLSLLRIENGTWTGATPGNSASNMTRVNHCRFIARAAAEVSLFSDQSGGISVRDCTFEGGNPVNNVWLSPSGNNSALYVEVENCWFENNPTGAHVKLDVIHKASVGFAYAEGGDVFIDAIGSSGNAVIEVTQFPYGASATYGANASPRWTTDVADDVKWVFRNTVGNNTRMTDPSLWTDGRVPTFLRHDGFGAQAYPVIEYTNTLSVTGSRSGNAALADLLTELAKIGLIVDSTSA